MAKTFNPMATALSAVKNASTVPIDADEALRLLRGGHGAGSHLRALFGDVGLTILMRIAIAHGIEDATLAQAYRHAACTHAAANPDLDKFAAEIDRAGQAGGAHGA